MRQQIDVGRDGLHLARREDEHAERIADQPDQDERQRRAVVDPDGQCGSQEFTRKNWEVDADGHHHGRVVAARAEARVVGGQVRAVVERRHVANAFLFRTRFLPSTSSLR